MVTRREYLEAKRREEELKLKVDSTDYLEAFEKRNKERMRKLWSELDASMYSDIARYLLAIRYTPYDKMTSYQCRVAKSRNEWSSISGGEAPPDNCILWYCKPVELQSFPLGGYNAVTSVEEMARCFPMYLIGFADAGDYQINLARPYLRETTFGYTLQRYDVIWDHACMAARIPVDDLPGMVANERNIPEWDKESFIAWYRKAMDIHPDYTTLGEYIGPDGEYACSYPKNKKLENDFRRSLLMLEISLGEELKAILDNIILDQDIEDKESAFKLDSYETSIHTIEITLTDNVFKIPDSLFEWTRIEISRITHSRSIIPDSCSYTVSLDVSLKVPTRDLTRFFNQLRCVMITNDIVGGLGFINYHVQLYMLAKGKTA